MPWDILEYNLKWDIQGHKDAIWTAKQEIKGSQKELIKLKKRLKKLKQRRPK